MATRTLREPGEMADMRDARPHLMPAQSALAQSPMSWSALCCGLLAVLSCLVLMGTLGLALGIMAPNAASAFSQRDAIWGLATSGIAFLLGGFIAGKLSGAPSLASRAGHGLMLFFLALPVSLILGALGLGPYFGPVGRIAIGFPSVLTAIAPFAPPAEDLRVAFASEIVGLLAACIGSLPGARSRPRDW